MGASVPSTDVGALTRTPTELAHALVVLAAGASTRMGSPKGLVVVGGETQIARVVGGFRRAGGARVIVVLGNGREGYEGAVASLSVDVAVNAAPERGQFSSL